MRGQIRDLLKLEEDRDDIPLLMKLLWNFQTSFGKNDPARTEWSKEMNKVVIPNEVTRGWMITERN